jgi:hypothetical protein
VIDPIPFFVVVVEKSNLIFFKGKNDIFSYINTGRGMVAVTPHQTNIYIYGLRFFFLSQYLYHNCWFKKENKMLERRDCDVESHMMGSYHFLQFLFFLSANAVCHTAYRRDRNDGFVFFFSCPVI